jgi:hypothetical protein
VKRIDQLHEEKASTGLQRIVSELSNLASVLIYKRKLVFLFHK